MWFKVMIKIENSRVKLFLCHNFEFAMGHLKLYNSDMKFVNTTSG